jgi:hypothetical protein
MWAPSRYCLALELVKSATASQINPDHRWLNPEIRPAFAGGEITYAKTTRVHRSDLVVTAKLKKRIIYLSPVNSTP